VASLQEQKHQVRRDLEIHGQTAQYPQVADDEVDQIIAATQLAMLWATATIYVEGDVIMPTTRNGHRYICIQSGTSGATEPDWPTVMRRTVDDGTGDTVVKWREDGRDYKNVYDLRQALHQCWLLKAQKVAHLHDARRSQSGADRSQIYEHCLEMAEKYAPLIIV
jgi:hypothetical protein